jgi:SAM-dependent methyltransferase
MSLSESVARASRLAREVEHHRSLAPDAETIWNWNSPSGRYRAARRVRLFVERGQLGEGRSALELGCGTGVFLEPVSRCGARLTAIDLSRDLLERAAARVRDRPNVKLTCGNAEDMPYPGCSFETVYGSSVLHHLHLDDALKEVHRVLRPGGRIVFAEPNMLNPQVAFMFQVGWTKSYFGVSPDERAFTRFRARRALRDAGFVDLRVEPFDFVHPALGARLVPRAAAIGRWLEMLPLISEIGGSLLIEARRADSP